MTIFNKKLASLAGLAFGLLFALPTLAAPSPLPNCYLPSSHPDYNDALKGPRSPYCHCADPDSDLKAKLQDTQKIAEYCACRDLKPAAYCSCVWADGRAIADCQQYDNPSYNYADRPDRDGVSFASIEVCISAGNSTTYCACRVSGGGTHDQCIGGGSTTYEQKYSECTGGDVMRTNPTGAATSYCACVAAGGDATTCMERSGVDRPAAQDDARASQMTAAAKEQAAGQTGATAGGGSGNCLDRCLQSPSSADGRTSAELDQYCQTQCSATAATGLPTSGTTAGGTATPARSSLPSLVPACARATGGAAPSLNCMLQLFGNIANLIVGLTGSLALLMFVYGGFLMITAAGAEDKIKKGKEVLRNAVFGIFIIMLSGYVVNYALQKIGVTSAVQGAACKTEAGTDGIQVSVGGRDFCAAQCADLGTGFQCTDTVKRDGGNTDCIQYLCRENPDPNYLCCPK